MAKSFLNNLTEFGIGQLDALISLVNGAPKLLTAELSKEDNLGPVMGPIIGSMAEKAIYGFYDELTGTADSDLSYSEYVSRSFVSGLRKRDHNVLSRTLSSAYGARSGRRAVSASANIKGLINGIYGPDAYDTMKDSVAVRGLEAVDRYFRRDAYSSGTKALVDAELGGADLGILTDARQLSEIAEAARGTDRYAAAERQAKAAQKRATAFVQRIGDETQKMIYGYVDERGTRVASITGSLSDAEVRSAIADFAKGGGFSSKNVESNIASMKDYIAKIAGGVDNIKQVMGSNTTMEQAMQTVSALAGTSAAVYNADTFNKLSSQFKKLAYNADITDKDWATATGYAMQELSGYGVPQILSAAAGMNVAAQFATMRNVNLGVSDREQKSVAAGLLTQQMRDGSLQNLGTLSAALKNIGMSDAQISKELSSLITSGNVYDADSMIKAVGVKDKKLLTTLFSKYWGSEAALEEQANPELQRMVTGASARRILTEVRSDIASGLGTTIDKDGNLVASGSNAKNIAALNKLLAGKTVTDVTSAELNTMMRAAGMDPLFTATTQQLRQQAEQRNRYGLGTVSVANAAVAAEQYKDPATGVYQRKGVAGLLQYVSSVGSEDGNTAFADMISIALTGTTGNFKNTSKLEALKGELRTTDITKIRLDDSEKKAVEEEIKRRITKAKKDGSFTDADGTRIRTEVETNAKLFRFLQDNGLKLLENYAGPFSEFVRDFTGKRDEPGAKPRSTPGNPSSPTVTVNRPEGPQGRKGPIEITADKTFQTFLKSLVSGIKSGQYAVVIDNAHRNGGYPA